MSVNINISLQQLICFHAVAKEQSFSGAAKVLYTSQPNVSNQIRRLEEHYGVQLFVRSPSNIELTEAGRELLQVVEGILDRYESIDRLMQDFRSLKRGSLQVGATATGHNHILPSHISNFLEHYPGVRILLRGGTVVTVVGSNLFPGVNAPHDGVGMTVTRGH
jgi:DNA-binding transcriptional LysR family regulator